MKRIQFIALGILFIIIGGIVNYTTTQRKYNNTPTIDLPEEYDQISNDPHRPDTMIAFYRGNKLFFRFVVAARYFPEDNH